MMRRIVRLVVVLASLSIAFAGSAQDAAIQQPDTLRSLAASYEPWQSVELSGKLRMAGLPLSPSVRIFMQRGSRIDVSVSAPFVGEAARVSLTRDSVQIVNRLKRVYCVEEIGHITSELPMAIGDVQDLLLGRVFDFSAGTLREDIIGNFSVFGRQTEAEPAGVYYIVPSPVWQMPSIEYGFVMNLIGADHSMKQFMVRKEPQAELTVDYSYGSGAERTLSLQLEISGRSLAAALDLGAPKWNAVPFRCTPLDSSFRRVSISEAIRF